MAIFIAMEGIWRSGILPFVRLFINYMKNIGYTNSDVDAWLVLAMSSTIAGNLTIPQT